LDPDNNIAINLTMAHDYNIKQQYVETPNNYCQPELITRGGMREGSVVEDAVERSSWGKSRCEEMCRFPNTGGLHHTSGGAPLETPTLRDPELITRGGMREGSVVENAVERNIGGKSRCEQMCRFPNTGGLHHTSGGAPLETPTLRDPELITGGKGGGNGMREGSVVEVAIARNSWGKSRCEQMCRFPNTGGLHRTSGDAPLETPTLQIPVPVWCGVYKSNSSSSKRTQVAAVAYKQILHHPVKHSTKHKRSLNANRKCQKQKYKLKHVVIGNGKFTPKCLSLNYIRKNSVVCDGGATESDALKSKYGIHYLRVLKGDLWTCDTVNASIGLRYRVKGGDNSPVFIRLPREESINIMKDGRSLCSAMRTCALTQRQTLTRGNINCVFTEDGNKYCCVGAQPGRAQRGVQSGLYRLKNGLPSKEWDLLHKVLKRAEYAFDGYMDTEVIRHITSARSRVHFQTMVPSPSSSSKKDARYYNGLGFGINVYLRSHIDADFTMSIVQAHIDNHDYANDDKIICYFAFPRIGTAVALRPGDFLLFNPREPHSVSSRCNREDDVYIISSYLKTAVVGLHDNSDPIV
jgi:hypothetical protein